MLEHRFAKSVLFVHSSLDDAGLTANEFRVYCHLARRAGAAGDSFPSAQTIADVCRIHKDTVWDVLRSLERRGMVGRKPRAGMSTVYVLTTPDQWIQDVSPPETDGRPSDSPTGNGGVGPTGNGGVGPTGNGGVLRVSTEGYPPKGIQAEQRVREDATSGRMSASEWEPFQEHRDLCGIRNADCDLQLSRFRERNVGQLDTDQGWSVRFRQWIGRSRPESRVTASATDSPTLDQWMQEAEKLDAEAHKAKMPEWPASLAEALWHDQAAKGWRHTSDWRSALVAAHKRFLGLEMNHTLRNQRRK